MVSGLKTKSGKIVWREREFEDKKNKDRGNGVKCKNGLGGVVK